VASVPASSSVVTQINSSFSFSIYTQKYNETLHCNHYYSKYCITVVLVAIYLSFSSAINDVDVG
jgi:hypothetical protein